MSVEVFGKGIGRADHRDNIAVVEGEGWSCLGLFGGVGAGVTLVGGAV